MGLTKSIHLRPGRRAWVARPGRRTGVDRPGRRSWVARPGRRAWVVIFLLLTIAGTAAAAEKLPRTYQSEASVVLLASRSAAKPNGGNPYLSFTPSLTLTADVLSTEIMAPESVQQLAAQGFSGSYTVALAPYSGLTTGSVLLVTATGNARTTAQSTLLAVTNEIHTKLAGLQTGIARRDQVRVRILSATRQATVSASHLIRSLAVLMVLGLVISFGVPRVIDAQLAGRRARRAARQPATAPLPASPVDDRPRAGMPAAAGRSPAAAGAGSRAGRDRALAPD